MTFSCDRDQYLVSTIQSNLHLKNGNVCILTRPALASLQFKGLATKRIKVNRTIHKGTYDALKIINLKLITPRLIFMVSSIFTETIHSVMSLTIIYVYG